MFLKVYISGDLMNVCFVEYVWFSGLDSTFYAFDSSRVYGFVAEGLGWDESQCYFVKNIFCKLFHFIN